MLFIYRKQVLVYLLLLGLLVQCKKKEASTPAPEQITKDVSYLTSILFLDAQNGFMAGGNGVVLRTQDGGNTWVHRNYASDEANSSAYFYPNLVDIFFMDKKTGWVCGANNGGIVYKTKDGGVNWTHVDVGGSTQILSKICFADSLNGFAIANSTYSFSGVNITIPGTPEAPDYKEYSKTSLYRTTDGGSSWTAVLLPTDSTIFSITFTDSQHGYIVGEYGLHLQTTDGGNTWVRKNLVFVNRSSSTSSSPSRPNSLTDVTFTSKDTGYIISNGYPCTLFKTTDGGNSWLDIDFYCVYGFGGDGAYLSFPRFAAYKDQVLMVAEDGLRGGIPTTYYVCTDGGYNWIEKTISGVSSSSDANYFMRFSFINSNTLIGIERTGSSNMYSPNKIIF